MEMFTNTTSTTQSSIGSEPAVTVALVTGASRGIGREVAEQLLSQNMHVVATCTDPTKVERLAHELLTLNKGAVTSVLLDVRKEDQVRHLADEILHHFGKLDILVNNAGIMDKNLSTVETQSVEDWDNIIATNLKGPFLLCKTMIPLLRKAGGGRIVNLSGSLGTFSSGMEGGGNPAYRISKAGINALTLTLSKELISDRILVTAVDPGWVRTDLGGPDAPRSAKEAASDVVHAATLPLEKTLTGCLLRCRTLVNY